jgi:spore coat polysaccharide biosynthesis protein SpsF
MRQARAAELVLGSVQLGLAYGAANRTGKPSRAAAVRLVHRAADAGISKFDTARAYGDSEERLGEALRSRKTLRAITKLSPLGDLPRGASRETVRQAVDRSIADSLAALKRERLDCLLLHRAEHMTAFGGAVWERLIELLEDGTLMALGVSVQSPEEAIQALECPDVRHLQLPFNLLDWRWRESAARERIAARPNVTIHARSIFLQGLLASDDPNIWPRIDGVDAASLIAIVEAFVREFGRQSSADLCLAHARAQPWIDGVVIGMETEDQLETNLNLAIRPPLAPEECAELEARLPRVPPQLLDPAQWPRGA